MALKFVIPSDCKCITQATIASNIVVTPYRDFACTRQRYCGGIVQGLGLYISAILWWHSTGSLPVHVSDIVVAQYRDFAFTRQRYCGGTVQGLCLYTSAILWWHSTGIFACTRQRYCGGTVRGLCLYTSAILWWQSTGTLPVQVSAGNEPTNH